MSVPCSGALTGVVATGGFKPMAKGTASVCGAPALRTEPPVATVWRSRGQIEDVGSVGLLLPHAAVSHL